MTTFAGDVDFAVQQDSHGYAWDLPIFNAAGDPVDMNLPGTTVALRYRDAGRDAAEVVRVGAVVATPPLYGQARYVFVAGDTGTPGRFLARFEVTQGANLFIYPPDRQMTFEVLAKP